MPIILGAGDSSSGYDIENSLVFNDGDKHYLQRNFDAGGSRTTFTVSLWVKRCEIDAANPIWGAGPSNGGQCSLIFDSSNRLQFREFNVTDNAEVVNLLTSGRFQDIAAWYHIVVAIDTTQGTASNRGKIYVNGQLADLETATHANQNKELLVNSTANTARFWIANETYSSTSTTFDGYLSEIYFINNAAQAPTDFGETDINGVWIPKDAKNDLTFGTNGFFLEFKQTGTSQNSSGIGADTSGEDHHFAIATNNNALDEYDVMTDTPTNNFPTWNFLQQNQADPISGFGQGHLSVTEGSNADWSTCTATQAVANGKWYWEVKISNLNGSVMPGVLRQAYASTLLAKTSSAYPGAD